MNFLQMTLYIRVEDIDEAKHKLSSLMSDLKIWMVRRKLKLNDGKTEIIVIWGNLRNVSVANFGEMSLAIKRGRKDGVVLSLSCSINVDFSQNMQAMIFDDDLKHMWKALGLAGLADFSFLH